MYKRQVQAVPNDFGDSTNLSFITVPLLSLIHILTDRLYYTNSYHVHVCEEIDAFSKLKFESQFHGISSVSYTHLGKKKFK